MAEQESLPPGWVAEWNVEHQRHLFIDQATGNAQWGPPTGENTSSVNSTLPAPAHNHPRRRQYAADQNQAYYGESNALPTSQFSHSSQQTQLRGQQLSELNVTSDNGFTARYKQPPLDAQQFEPNYRDSRDLTNENTLGNWQGSFSADGLAGQFGKMSFDRQTSALSTVNLLTTPPDPSLLLLAPPKITLPAGTGVLDSPNANASYFCQRCTVNAFPSTSSLATKSKVPLALIINPYKTLQEGEEPVPLVSDMIIARCRRCRTYINPYVQFTDNNNRWRCSTCLMLNEVPQAFDWDVTHDCAADRWARPELNHGVVEFVAPTEYMVRPPQPVIYVLLVDVSYTAVRSGMTAIAARTILESLDRLPNEDHRTKLAIVGFDSVLYFFHMPTGTSEVNIIVVSDVDDVFLPKPSDILVNLTAARVSIESLLGRMHEMFQGNLSTGSALGSALQAGFKLMNPVGGKLMVLTCMLPSVGPGALKLRDDPKVYGTPKESAFLHPASSFYKSFAIDCSRAQISVDMFLFSQTYQDIATLACLPHYTSGQTHYYHAFDAAHAEDSMKFAHEFGEVLAMPIMLDAVTRVRASSGLRMSSFHGNFFVRSTDLLAMPTVPQDVGYVIEMEIEENLLQPFVVLQTAVLHTTCYGERRIRVITTALPTTSSLSDLFASVDQVALTTLLANKAVERSLTHKLEDARAYLVAKLVEILRSYNGNMAAAGASANAQLAVAENMKMLPLLVLGILKNTGIRQGSQIPADDRAYALTLLTSLPSQSLLSLIHPSFYSLHNMPVECGSESEKGIILPPLLSLSSQHFERHGFYLIEDGQTIFLWVGRDAIPQLVADVFDLPNYNALRGGKTALPVLDNPFSQRVNAIITEIRRMRSGVYYPQVYVVKEDGDPSLRLRALSALIQDRVDGLPSYQQFIEQLRDKVHGSSY